MGLEDDLEVQVGGSINILFTAEEITQFGVSLGISGTTIGAVFSENFEDSLFMGPAFDDNNFTAIQATNILTIAAQRDEIEFDPSGLRTFLTEEGELATIQDAPDISILDMLEAHWQALSQIGFDQIYDEWQEISEAFTEGDPSRAIARYGPLLNQYLIQENRPLYQIAVKIFPTLDFLLQLYDVALREQSFRLQEEREADPDFSWQDQLMDAFNKPGLAEGEGYEWAGSYHGTSARVRDAFLREFGRADEPTRPNTYPPSINAWEMRIGTSRLFVPPINVHVSQTFRVGSLTGGALREQTSMKFNSGHSETMISMTLYFPNEDEIWGFEGNELDIDITDNSIPDSVLDRFSSSARGLITAFKYAPFLPIRNAYLNSVYGITGVTLHSMTVSTMPQYPACLVVNLQMLKFNHKVYLPMIEDFHQAMHWGRFRQYLTRAAQKMSEQVNKGFLIEKPLDQQPEDGINAVDPETGEWYQKPDPLLPDTAIGYEEESTTLWSKSREWNDGKHFEFYYPAKTPARVFAPDTSDFRQPFENEGIVESSSKWATFLGFLGISVDADPDATYDRVSDFSQNYDTRIPTGIRERDVLWEWINHINLTAEQMTEEKFEQFFVDQLLPQVFPSGDQTEAQEAELREAARREWYNAIFFSWRDTPFFREYLQYAETSNSPFIISEWKVPMEKLGLDWNKIVINGVSVTLSNNIARLQLQMQEEPVHQHIGGRDSRIDVSMTVFGESELNRMKRMFSHIGGLARLEHAHGVLGFLGVRNIVTALCGIKYAMPLTFEIDNIPSVPHVYRVRLSFVDFDLEQQKREQLSSSQQKELIDSFGKRNPFLRIKQQWGAFSAYPDFPLSLKDENNNIVGHLDPDFYFRSWQLIDDDVVNWGIEEQDADGTTISDLANKVKNNAQTVVVDEAEEAVAGGADPAVFPPVVDAIEDLVGRVLDNEDQTAPTAADTAETIAEVNISQLGAAPTDYYNVFNNVAQTVSTRASNYVHTMVHYLGLFDETQVNATQFSIRGSRMSIKDINSAGGGEEVIAESVGLNEDGPHQIGMGDGPFAGPSVPGVDSTAFGRYQQPLVDGSRNPGKQYEFMMRDAQHRDKNGRMVRAFPTYMLWLIDEGGRFGGTKLFDNFYGLQSVIDFSIHQSEDILGDTLLLRVSNMYQKLTTGYKKYLLANDSDFDAVADGNPNADEATAVLVDTPALRWHNLQSGLNDQYLFDLENIRLKPGVRVHLRAGYSANPNALETLFNGVITEVRQGEIMEIVAQSDAIELSPFINTTSEKGHSGKIDGAMNTGLWLSEPRDLMVRLLSMGSSTFREAFAHATRGAIFSENKFGIRHFGQMLYEPLTDEEFEKQNNIKEVVASDIQRVAGADSATGFLTAGLDATSGNPVGGFFDSLMGETSVRSPMIAIMQSMWTNFFKKADYEIFKRNIYPGNGMGVAQYLGGDLLDGGMWVAAAAGSELPEGSFLPPTAEQQLADAEAIANEQGADGEDIDPITGEEGDASQGAWGQALDLAEVAANPFSAGLSAIGLGGVGDTINNLTNPVTQIRNGFELLGGFFSGRGDNPFLQMMGITGRDEDLAGFDEVSFRAQTYMKSVWDLFRLCAALLPNYIVAVRPFEDRSTVFYGKPHWLYTSGLIPLSTGIPPSETPDFVPPDAELQRLIRQAAETANPLADAESQTKFMNFVHGTSIDPYGTTSGLPWQGGDIQQLPTVHPNGAKIPVRSGTAGLEMHLPAVDPNTGQATHFQVPGLKQEYQYPNYIDGPGGLRGGEPGFEPGLGHDQDPLEAPAGAYGGLYPYGFLPAQYEQYYMNMRFPDADSAAYGTTAEVSRSLYKDVRVLVYNERTAKACVCIVGDWGPFTDHGAVAGISPDVAHVVGHNQYTGTTVDTENGLDNYWFGFVDDNTPLGPVTDVQFGDGIQQVSADPEASAPQQDAEPTEIEQAAEFLGVTVEELESTAGMETALAFFAFDEDLTAEEMQNLIDQGLDTPITYAYEYGWEYADIPVWIDPDRLGGFTDQAGERARLLWDRDYANQFSAESGVYSGGDLDNVTTAAQASGLIDENGEELASGQIVTTTGETQTSNEDFVAQWGPISGGGRTLEEAESIWDQFRNEWRGYDEVRVIEEAWEGTAVAVDDPDEGVLAFPEDARGNGDHEFWQQARNDFTKFLWQNPYSRAWLVITTARHFDGTSIGFTGTAVADLDLAGGFIPDPELEILGQNIDFNPVPELANSLTGGNEDTWHFSSSTVLREDVPTESAYYQFLTNYLYDSNSNGISDMVDPEIEDKRGNQAFDSMLGWMEENDEAGADAGTANEGLVEGLRNLWDESIGALIAVASDALSGLISMFRMSLMQLGEGLHMLASQQRQANIMNKVFNDSIYYAAGSPGSITRLADNPFTREYAEPVVEVREPFQRMHYLDSFTDIISNNTTETLNNVATTITASSDGQYPVTVYFDKGAPTERQVEATVETGLFWDNAKGSGFFGFLHPLFHPIETIRGLHKVATGSSDELLARRVGLWHLKERLKDIYSGEITVIGRGDIRPHDLVYLADVYERMYGMVEVEAVTHHFTPDSGFITSITPNALVTINDPARWSLISYAWSWWAVKNARDDVRSLVSIKADDTSPIASSEGVEISDLWEALDIQRRGWMQFTHGGSALTRDIATGLQVGMHNVRAENEKIFTDVERNLLIGSTAVGLFGGIGTYLLGSLAWKGWEWVRDNLLDQHGCYIQYLNKDGQPMDAGLSYNQGVAVGHHHSLNLLPGILNLNVPTIVDGNRRITTNDLLAALGWNEVDIAGTHQWLTLAIQMTNAQVLDISGVGPDTLVHDPNVEVFTINRVIDGDTFEATGPNGSERIRLSGVDAFELEYKDSLEKNRLDDPGRAAAEFAQERLINDVISLGLSPQVVVRWDPKAGPGRDGRDVYDRILGTVFHSVPDQFLGSNRERVDKLLEYATGRPHSGGEPVAGLFKPAATWDSYQPDGKPYTFNWELIVNGHAFVNLDGLRFNDTDRGITTQFGGENALAYGGDPVIQVDQYLDGD